MAGKGRIDAFNHVQGGICFLCNGSKAIDASKRYPRKDKIVCEVSKGFVTHFTKDWQSTKVYRECISLSFDGGRSTTFGRMITDQSRSELRGVWLWAKNNGATMIVNDEDCLVS